MIDERYYGRILDYSDRQANNPCDQRPNRERRFPQQEIQAHALAEAENGDKQVKPLADEKRNTIVSKLRKLLMSCNWKILAAESERYADDRPCDSTACCGNGTDARNSEVKKVNIQFKLQLGVQHYLLFDTNNVYKPCLHTSICE